MSTTENQTKETKLVLDFIKWAAWELPERPNGQIFEELKGENLLPQNLRYDGKKVSYQDEKLSIEIGRGGVSMSMAFQKRKTVPVYQKYASIISFSVLGVLAVPVMGHVVAGVLQAEENRMHLNDCQSLQQRKADLDTAYYRDGEISPKAYKKESETLSKAMTRHAQLWSDYCPYSKENVKE